jgi:hemerythrin superfamily protein
MATSTTDALQVLKESHQQLSGLFELFRNSPDLNEKLTLFQELKDELGLYGILEQKVLYPQICDFDDLTDILDTSFDEHDEMNDLADEIDQMEVEAVEGDEDEGGAYDSTPDASAEFDDAVDELRSVFLRHVEREERELFPQISELLSEDDLVSLGNQMNELRSLGMAA